MRSFLRFIFPVLLFLGFGAVPALAQTITIGTVDPGPYTPGSNITVPITVSGPCVNVNTTYKLFLSDAAGNFAPAAAPIGTFNNFYATFVNGTLPLTGLAPGTYKVKVTTADTPPIESVNTATINVVAGAAVKAALDGGNFALYGQDVLAYCGSPNSRPTAASIFENSTNATAVTVLIHDESPTPTPDATRNPTVGGGLNFPVVRTNYTLWVTATNGGNKSTHGYQLVNNYTNTTFGTNGSQTACVGGDLTFNVNYTSSAADGGIEFNYPGDVYTFDWGDNGATSQLSLCQIIALNGHVSHTYTSSSCGKTVNGQMNVVRVAVVATSPYCGKYGEVSTIANVLTPAKNLIGDSRTGRIVAPGAIACTGGVTLTNMSYPGSDPNTGGDCTFTNPKYSWSIDGNTPLPANRNLPLQSVTLNLSPGQHTVTLHYENNPSCGGADTTITICVLAPPQPKFTIPTATCNGATGIVTPTDQSVVDQTAPCASAYTYLWTVTPSTFSFVGGTNKNSPIPQIQFNTPGSYQITLSITTPNCGTVATAPQTIVVNSNPVISMSPNAFFCGPQILNFSPSGGKTATTLSGTTVEVADTYTWTVTGGTYSFSNGTNANTKYPQITFNDFAAYTVTVTHKNSCLSTSKSQTITIQDAPVPNAGADKTICPVPTYQLTGTVTGNTGPVTSTTWTKVSGGDGTLSNTSTLTPTYTLGPNDLAHGGVVQFKLTVNTSLGAPCDVVTSTVNITITSPDYLTSAPTGAICSAQGLNYTITSTNAGATYAWTAAVTSGQATIQTTSGTTNKITGTLTNTDATGVNDAVVRYTIVPTSANGCISPAIFYDVTVHPKPQITPITTPPAQCSGAAANVPIGSPLAGTKFIWASTVTSGTATGNSQHPSASAATTIADILSNPGTIPAVIRYTITPVSASGCTGDPVTVDVTVNPDPTIADADVSTTAPNPSVNICGSATTVSYTLNANASGSAILGTGKWTQPAGQTAVFADDTNPKTTVSGLVSNQQYRFTWTISSACGSSSSTIAVIVDPPSVGGITQFANGTDKLTICSGGGGTITLSGNVGHVVRWELSTDNGANYSVIAGNNTNTTYTFNNLTQTTLFRAIVQDGACSIAASAPATVTVDHPPSSPNAGNPQILCNAAASTNLNGNVPPAGTTGTWTLTSGQTGVIIADSHDPKTKIDGLTGGQTYTFTWTFDNVSVCGVMSDQVQITDQTAIVNVIQANATTICNGASVTIGTSGTVSGGTAPYTYKWEQSTDGTTWSPVNGQTGAALTTTLTATTYFRRTVTAGTGSCNLISNVIKINVLPAITNNTISSPTPLICGNTAPDKITGSVPTGGDGINYTYQWQQSTNNGTTFTDIQGATGPDYTPPALNGKVIYRRLVSSGPCADTFSSTSNQFTITINPSVVANFTAVTQNSCAPFVITSVNINATSDPNASTYTWYANNTPIGTGYTFPGYTIATQGTKVTIKLVVSSSLGCADASYSLDFSTFTQSVAAFNLIRSGGGCGPQIVNFNNTSTPSDNVTYTWSFGDGTANYVGTTPPAHTFAPDQFGNDVTYTVKLTAGGCTPTFATQQITVYAAKPVAIIDPGPPNGCAPYAITVKNISLGTNASYTFYLKDETGTTVQTITKTDKSNAVFSAINTTVDVKVYTVYMKATDLCGVDATTAEFPITIAPTGITARMSITPSDASGNAAGCGPFLATFHNQSTGGISYVYNIYDSNFHAIDFVTTDNKTTTTNYNFAIPGTYYVSVGTFSNCAAGLESAKIKVTVYPVPAPDFTSDANTTSCSQMTVKFTNNTPGAPNAPASSYTYTWDFGDGTTSNAFSPTHTFGYQGSPFTVTLSVVNNNGCSGILTKTALIKVNPPPETEFTANPGLVVSIPEYTLHFIDKTKNNPVKWTWDLGDGTTSNQQNPSHTYADTGRYTVTLTTVTAAGCTDSKTHLVSVTGVPGQLYIPNAFMPTSLSQELRVFTVKGSGIKKWTMRIFNNWGQMIFETTKLSGKGEPIEFWDGTFKGVDAPQGVYAWEISADFINGTTWKGMSYRGSAPKRAGTFTLIR